MPEDFHCITTSSLTGYYVAALYILTYALTLWSSEHMFSDSYHRHVITCMDITPRVINGTIKPYM